VLYFLKAQDGTFNNTHNSLVYLNPSFSGSNHGVRNQTVYRNQRQNLSGTTVLFNTSFDGYVEKIKGGVSLSFYSKHIGRGLIRQNRVSMAYAQYFSSPNSDIKIIPSVQFNYGVNNLRTNQLSFPTPSYPQFGLSPNLSSAPKGSVNYYDLSAGLLFYSGSVYFGASVFNILQPNISFAGIYKVPVRAVLHASNNIAINRRAKANLFASYAAQGIFSTVNIRLLNTYANKFLWGLGYIAYFDKNPKFFNNANNLSFYVGYRSGPFTINYTYDVPVGKLFDSTYGSHELSFSLSFQKQTEETRKKYKELEKF